MTYKKFLSRIILLIKRWKKCHQQNSIVNSTRVPPPWPLRPNTPWNKDQSFRAVNSVGKARVNFWQSDVLFQLKLQQLYSISFRYIVLSCWHPQEIKKNHTLGWIPSWDPFEHHQLDFFQFAQFWKYLQLIGFSCRLVLGNKFPWFISYWISRQRGPRWQNICHANKTVCITVILYRCDTVILCCYINVSL